MNLYVLTEGETEKAIYEAWLLYLMPELKLVNNYKDATANSCFILRSGGRPRLLGLIPDSIVEINETKVYDWLVIVLDSDHQNEITSTYLEVLERVRSGCIKGGTLQAGLTVIIQNVCIETWLLGNIELFSSSTKDLNLRSHLNFYRPDLADPELMPLNPKENNKSVSVYHATYFKDLIRNYRDQNRNLDIPRYTKKHPGYPCQPEFVAALQNRISTTPTHLQTLQYFMDFTARIQFGPVNA